jgi:hypothetical protein
MGDAADVLGMVPGAFPYKKGYWEEEKNRGMCSNGRRPGRCDRDPMEDRKY